MTSNVASLDLLCRDSDAVALSPTPTQHTNTKYRSSEAGADTCDAHIDFKDGRLVLVAVHAAVEHVRRTERSADIDAGA